MAVDGGLLTGGPELSLCLLLAAHSSIEQSTPGHPLKEEKETDWKSNQSVEMNKIKHGVAL